MSFEEFLSWKKFIEKEVRDELDYKGLILSNLAHLAYYTYDLRFVLGGSNRLTPKDFFIQLKKEPQFENEDDLQVTEEEFKNRMEQQKSALGFLLGMNYSEIKRKHGLK